LVFEAASSLDGVGVSRQSIPAEGSIAGWVYTRGEPLVIQNAVEDPRYIREPDALARFQTRSILGVPLKTKDKALGVIEALNKRASAFEEEDTRVLQTLAAQAAIAIENTRLFQQSDLVAEMVHELRTPMGALSAASHLLLRPDLPDEQRRRMSQAIADEVRRLNELATDFLEWARLESGRVRLSREPVDLGGLVHETLEVIRPHAESEAIVLETDIERTIPPTQGDRNRLKQLLLNLLTNAIKYNQRGGRISIRLVRDGDKALLAVSDTGRGIPAESLPRIFERFYRVPDRSGATTGTGLGLAIAKRIAESHFGTIEVESEPGHGTTFTVRLPVGSSLSPDSRPIR
jgi:two-component system phosphate regulon sensor histidine kinase PhoR